MQKTDRASIREAQAGRRREGQNPTNVITEDLMKGQSFLTKASLEVVDCRGVEKRST